MYNTRLCQATCRAVRNPITQIWVFGKEMLFFSNFFNRNSHLILQASSSLKRAASTFIRALGKFPDVTRNSELQSSKKAKTRLIPQRNPLQLYHGFENTIKNLHEEDLHILPAERRVFHRTSGELVLAVKLQLFSVSHDDVNDIVM